VVSDVDDTLKISHALSTLSAAETTVEVGNSFLGMSELLNSLKAKDGIVFAYVSNAPATLMQGLHEMFVSYNGYPKGTVYLRDSFFTTDFKIDTIPKLIRYYNPTKTILLGDNGERDAYILSQVQVMFPKLPIYAYIHQVYSVKNELETGTLLRVNQKGFVTSVDLAYELHQIGVLQDADYQLFLKTLIPEILKSSLSASGGEIAFPAWMDCRDFVSPLKSSPDALVQSYENLLQKRCR
jgi:phosphatidate phosphatase APP1